METLFSNFVKFDCNELDDEITINEIYKIVMGAKNGKSPGIDLIQAELCKNQIVIYVHKCIA